METYIILHNIRSAYNVGSIFRTADGAGVACVFLTGYTPEPIDRFGRVQPDIQKTSLGAADSVPWEHHTSPEIIIERLREQGTHIVAVEQCAQAIPYRQFKRERKTAFIFGNETEGVPESLLRLSDTSIEIPMHGEKESLNVSVAAGIILFNTQ